MAIDYGALLDRIMKSDDPLDPDDLLAMEGNRDEIQRRLKEKKLGWSDQTLDELEDIVAARLRVIGV